MGDLDIRYEIFSNVEILVASSPALKLISTDTNGNIQYFGPVGRGGHEHSPQENNRTLDATKLRLNLPDSHWSIP